MRTQYAFGLLGALPQNRIATLLREGRMLRRIGFLRILMVVMFAVIPTRALANDTPKTAEELAEAGYTFVQRGEFAKAIEAYAKAYELSADGRNLYNVANIYDRRLHERELASEYYRRYLRSPQAEPDLLKRANERISALKEEEEAIHLNAVATDVPKVPVKERSESPPPAASPDPTMRVAGIAAMGLGGVGLVLGTAFGLSASSKNDKAAALCDGPACRSREALSLTDDARSAATVSTVGFIGGSVLIAGGLAVFFLAPKALPKERISTALRAYPQVGPAVAGIGIGGTFQ